MATKTNGIGYQKFRGNPETKLFYLLDNFIGGINTEFTDDSSSPADFEHIINFDMDKLGTLHKRQGFGELNALSDLFNLVDQAHIPVVKNRTESNPNPEEENDNIVYMNLLQNDNNCFRNLAGFSGKNGYRDYQKNYGFQNNTFILFLLTSNVVNGNPITSKAWYYKCTLPEFILRLIQTSDVAYQKSKDYFSVFQSEDTIYQEGKTYLSYNSSTYIHTELIEGIDYGVGETITPPVYEYRQLVEGEDYKNGDIIQRVVYNIVDNVQISAYKVDLPVIFEWDRNLLNMENIEFYDNIYFTHNDKGLVCFNRSAEINSASDLANAFSYAGFTTDGVTNTAYKPSTYEVGLYGYNMLAGSDPRYYVEDNSILVESIQGLALFDKNFQPIYQTIPIGQPFKVGVYYTGSNNNFNLSFKDMTSETTYSGSDVSVTANETYSRQGLKVYDVQFKVSPTNEVEVKVEMQGSSISPQYDYYKVGSIENDAPQITTGINVGDCGLIFMHDRAVYYKKDTIWFSQINDFTYIPSNNRITLPLVSTDEITKICYFKKSYIVFTKYQIHKITGGYSMTLDDLSREIVNESIGCHAGNTVVPIDNTLYFASPRGLFSLKSNQFVEGYENVGELDTKIKTLTSDYTLYAEDREKPAIRYNGINAHAYAFRYKDKYILFYNNYDDKGDYAAQNNLDALVFQYEIGSYTTYRFKEKPSFLFLTDNAIETIATVKVKEELTEGQTLFDYDFSANLSSDNKVIDRSGNGNNASLNGAVVLNKGNGVKLNGQNAYGTIPDVGGNLTEGFAIQVETKFDSLNGAWLIDLEQASESVNSQKTSGEFVTNTNNNCYAKIEYTISPNASTKKDTVSYKVYLIRTGDMPSNYGTYYFRLVGSEGVFFDTKSVSYNLDNGSQLVDNGTFTITRDANGNYSSNWSFGSTVEYVITSSGINKGPTTYYDGSYYNVTTNRGNQFSWLQVGFSEFRAEPTDTGCKITYTPAVRLTSGWYPGSPYMEVTIDGTTYSHSLSGWSGGRGTSSSPYIKTAGQNITYVNYTGEKTLSISIHLHGTFTRNSDGLYYTDYYANGLVYNAPLIEPYIISSTGMFYLDKTTNITLNGYGGRSYREISLKQADGDQLAFFITSEYGNFALYTPQGIGLLERHTWIVSVDRGGNCNIYRDNTVVASGVIPTQYLINTTRTVNSFGVGRNRGAYCDGEFYYLAFTAANVTQFAYYFNNSSGNIATDTSSYGRNMTLYNPDWLVSWGLSCRDASGFLSIPTISSEIPLSNGFKISFGGIINANSNITRVIDLAKAYQSETSSVKFASINVGFRNNMMAFNSTSVTGRSYRVEANNIDTTVFHNYVIDCVDNGNGYIITMYVDNESVASSFFNYGGISDLRRTSNLICKSNDSTEISTFAGILNYLKFDVYGSVSGVPVYRSAIYEFDTTPTDFGQPIYVDVLTKGVNMDYPQHLKKLKHTFIKAIGGDEFSQLFFALYVDGHLVNDPTKYAWHLDENGTVVLEYYDEENMDVNGTLSILGNIIIDKTKLDVSTYQTIKMVVPKKGKNFAIRIYGDSEEFLTLDSFGLVCKLGKVKQG